MTARENQALLQLAVQVGEAVAGQKALHGEVSGMRADFRDFRSAVEGRLEALETRRTLEDGASGERRRWLGYGRAAVARAWKPAAAAVVAVLGLNELLGPRP